MLIRLKQQLYSCRQWPMDDTVFDFFMCFIITEISTHKFCTCIATSIILECQHVCITVLKTKILGPLKQMKLTEFWMWM